MAVDGSLADVGVERVGLVGELSAGLDVSRVADESLEDPDLGHRQIDRLAFPAIIAGIAEPVISLVDTAFVGRLGTADLAAVGIASSFFLLVVWVLAQTRSAVMAIVARSYGADRLGDVKDLVPLAIWMNVLLGLLFFSITSWFAEPIFRMYNAEGEVLAKAVKYYNIRSIGHPIVLATFAWQAAMLDRKIPRAEAK